MDVTDDLGYAPIHYACRAGNLSTFSALAELGGEDFDVDVFTKAGETPLMLALGSRNEDLIASVLEKSANPFFKNCLQRTAIDIATDTNNAELIRQVKSSEEQW